jgi:hypothetical protein
MRSPVKRHFRRVIPVLEKELLLQLEAFVNSRRNLAYARPLEAAVYSDSCLRSELEEFIENRRKLKFNQVLFEYIDQRRALDADIYKKAGLDRRHFSKIRSNPDYRPGKNTVIALALALELDSAGADRLLLSAGYSLSDADTFDLVIRFCLDRRIYGLDDVNLALDYFSLKPLAGVAR